MIITDKKYSLEKKMVEYLDRIADRVSSPSPKLDYPLLIDGYEGYGKSNFAIGAGYYIAQVTRRNFGLENIFFDPEKLIEFATHKEKQVIIWDEMALVALAMQRGDKWQLAIIQTLMMARKKRHFFVFCIPRFYRLKEAIIERCMGLVHVYARREKELGRFFFYRKAALDAMYEDWKRLRRKPKYVRYITVRGTFGECLNKIVDEESYEKKKDEAIVQILERLKGRKKNYYTEKMKEKLQVLAKIIIDNGLVKDFEERTGLNNAIIYRFAKNPDIEVPA